MLHDRFTAGAAPPRRGVDPQRAIGHREVQLLDVFGDLAVPRGGDPAGRDADRPPLEERSYWHPDTRLDDSDAATFDVWIGGSSDARRRGVFRVGDAPPR